MIPPIVYMPGDSFDAERHLLEVLWVQGILDRGISADMFYRDGAGNVVLSSNIDLQNHRLLGASNVPTGIVSVRSFMGGASSLTSDLLQAALNRINSDGFKSVYLPPGRYDLDKPVYVPNGMRLFGCGYQTYIFGTGAEAPSGNNLLVLQGSGSSVEDMRIGANTPGFNTGVRVIDGTDVVIRNLILENLYLGVGIDNSVRVTIANLFSTGCDTMLSASDVAVLKGNVLLHTADATRKGDGLVVSGCDGVDLLTVQIEDAKNGVIMKGVSNGKIEAHVQNCDRAGISIGGGTLFNIANSWSLDNAQEANQLFPGIELTGCTGCSVKNTNSSATSGKQTYGVVVSGGSSNLIGGCVLSPNKGPAGAGSPTVDEFDARWQVKDDGENTLIYATQTVVVTQPTSV